MAYTSFIPKIEWLENTVTGTTTISSDTITAIADTSNVEAGMYFEGAGIPADALVVSKTASTVTLDKDATASASGITFDHGFRITFDYPPAKDPLGETLKFKGSIVKSRSGAIQSLEDYQEETNKITFSHLSQTLKDSLKNFLKTHALNRKTFTYFEDKGEATSARTMQLDSGGNNIKFDILTRKAGGKNFLWKTTLNMREVI